MVSLLEKPFMKVRPSYMPKYWPLPSSCVLYTEGQQDAYSNTIRDLSGNGNNGTILGSTWVRLSSGLWYLSFDGSNDVVNCGNGASLSANNISMECWVQLSTGCNAYGGIICKDNGAAAREYGIGIASNGRVDLFTSADGTNMTQVSVTTNHDLDKWYHVAGVVNGTDLRIYSNGVLNCTPLAFANNIFATSTTVVLGVLYDTWFLKGFIALARIYNIALSATTIAQHFQQERHLFGV